MFRDKETFGFMDSALQHVSSNLPLYLAQVCVCFLFSFFMRENSLTHFDLIAARLPICCWETRWTSQWELTCTN